MRRVSAAPAPRDRLIWILHRWQQLSLSETAEATELSVATVKRSAQERRRPARSMETGDHPMNQPPPLGPSLEPKAVERGGNGCPTANARRLSPAHGCGDPPSRDAADRAGRRLAHAPADRLALEQRRPARRRPHFFRSYGVFRRLEHHAHSGRAAGSAPRRAARISHRQRAGSCRYSSLQEARAPGWWRRRWEWWKWSVRSSPSHR